MTSSAAGRAAGMVILRVLSVTFLYISPQPHFDLEPDYIVRKPMKHRFQRYIICMEILSHASRIHFSANNTLLKTRPSAHTQTDRWTHKNRKHLADIQMTDAANFYFIWSPVLRARNGDIISCVDFCFPGEFSATSVDGNSRNFSRFRDFIIKGSAAMPDSLHTGPGVSIVQFSVRENVRNNSKNVKVMFFGSWKNVKNIFKNHTYGFTRHLITQSLIHNYRKSVLVSHQHQTSCSEMRTQETMQLIIVCNKRL